MTNVHIAAIRRVDCLNAMRDLCVTLDLFRDRQIIQHIDARRCLH